MGIELDVLVGHPDHELLFVTTQVVTAAGLKNPYVAAGNFRRLKGNAEVKWLTLGDIGVSLQLKRGEGPVQGMPHTTSLMSEVQVYQLLLRGHAPQSEPFRKWVYEEVLPTIRRTGSYNAEESSNPIAVGVMDELKTLRLEVGELKAMIQGLHLTAGTQQAPSPYEGVQKGTVWYHRDVQAIRKAGSYRAEESIVIKTLTVETNNRRTIHDNFQPSTIRSDHRSNQAWPRPPHQSHRQSL